MSTFKTKKPLDPLQKTLLPCVPFLKGCCPFGGDHEFGHYDPFSTVGIKKCIRGKECTKRLTAGCHFIGNRAEGRERVVFHEHREDHREDHQKHRPTSFDGDWRTEPSVTEFPEGSTLTDESLCAAFNSSKGCPHKGSHVITPSGKPSFRVSHFHAREECLTDGGCDSCLAGLPTCKDPTCTRKLSGGCHQHRCSDGKFVIVYHRGAAKSEPKPETKPESKRDDDDGFTTIQTHKKESSARVERKVSSVRVPSPPAGLVAASPPPAGIVAGSPPAASIAAPVKPEMSWGDQCCADD